MSEKPDTMGKREARQWIREHFAEYVLLSDIGVDVPDAIANAWGDECERIANRIDPKNTWKRCDGDQS